jgi:pimeloyl-ACP methyl ester carboxylesterase
MSAMRSGRARIGGAHDVELAYDVFGDGGMPLVLIMGIGVQRLFWDRALCEQFVDAGFHVVRFDARELGESSRLPHDVPVPRPGRLLVRRLLGLRVRAPYDLSDSANDVVGLLDALGWDAAHLVGISLGGMVAQHLAIEHPDRVRSATLVMTSPGARRYLPAPRAFGALFQPPPKTAEEAGNTIAHIFDVIGSPAWPADDDRRAQLRALGAQSHARGASPRGFLRQFAAVLASGDRRRALPAVRAPTLVIHGSRDPMFPLSAGRALAALIPGATWLPIAGMGHDLPPPLWPAVVRAIARHARRAEA